MPADKQRIAEILRNEEMAQGRPCRALDCTTLSGDDGAEVTVLLYRPEPRDHGDLGWMIEDRVVAFAGPQQLYSAIVRTRWEKPRAR